MRLPRNSQAQRGALSRLLRFARNDDSAPAQPVPGTVFSRYVIARGAAPKQSRQGSDGLMPQRKNCGNCKNCEKFVDYLRSTKFCAIMYSIAN
jgi:hypothetical protein